MHEFLSCLRTFFIVFTGKQQLGLVGVCNLASEDGCDIDGDEGLLYAVNEKKTIIFHCAQGASVEGIFEANDTLGTPCSTDPWHAVYRVPQIDPQIEAKLQAIEVQSEGGSILYM